MAVTQTQHDDIHTDYWVDGIKMEGGVPLLYQPIGIEHSNYQSLSFLLMIRICALCCRVLT